MNTHAPAPSLTGAPVTPVTAAPTAVAWRELWPEGTQTAEWSHSGIAVTDTGSVVFAEPGGGGLVVLGAPDASAERSVARVGVPLLEIHGIHYHRDDAGESLWLADPGWKARPDLGYEHEQAPGQAGRLDLETLEFTPLAQPPHLAYAERGWEPTSVVTLPPDAASGTAPGAVVCDGYGASLVHLYRGGVIMRTIDGRASGTRFSCPHGAVVDTRGDTPVLVIADRGNRRLVVYTLDGAFIRVIDDALFTSPSSVALRGTDLLVTELDGALLAVDRDDSVRALVLTRSETERPGWPNQSVDGHLERPPLEPERLNSPHGIAVASDGRIYLTEWLIGGRQLELTIADSPAAAN